MLSVFEQTIVKLPQKCAYTRVVVAKKEVKRRFPIDEKNHFVVARDVRNVRYCPLSPSVHLFDFCRPLPVHGKGPSPFLVVVSGHWNFSVVLLQLAATHRTFVSHS